MTSQVATYLSEAQWSGVHALCGVIEAMKPIVDDLEQNFEAWMEWANCELPEDKADGQLPGEWEGKLSLFQRLLLIRVMRPDRVTAAVALFVRSMMGNRYIDQPTFNMKETFEDSSAPTPLFFVLFPGVDPGGEIEKLGRELGFTEANGRYKSISMGQGQEKNAEDAMLKYAAEGGWLFLQNVHLMETWLPKLERALEIAAETGHDDFRCFLSAEAPPLPDNQSVPEGIMQVRHAAADHALADRTSAACLRLSLLETPLSHTHSHLPPRSRLPHTVCRPRSRSPTSRPPTSSPTCAAPTLSSTRRRSTRPTSSSGGSRTSRCCSRSVFSTPSSSVAASLASRVSRAPTPSTTAT